MARIMDASKASRRSNMKKAVALAAAAATAGSGLQCAFNFATTSLTERPTFVDSPDGTRFGKAAKNFRSDNNYGSSNLDLQLSDGFPGSFGPQVGQGPPWATCIATVEGTASLTLDGIVERPNILEQWVMRGHKENTDAFMAWRERMADGPVNVRCSQTNLKDVEDVVCLECVSHVGGFPFLPETPLVPSGFLVSDLQQCVKRSFDGTGFCKSASALV